MSLTLDTCALSSSCVIPTTSSAIVLYLSLIINNIRELNESQLYYTFRGDLVNARKTTDEMRLTSLELEKINKDLCEQKKMLEKWRVDMKVEKKETKGISEIDMSCYKVLTSSYFASLRAKHVKSKLGEVQMTVQANPPLSNMSFSLQKFLDGYYSNEPSLQLLAMGPAKLSKKEKALKQVEVLKQVANTRLVLFGDDCEFIAHALLSTWKITFKENAGEKEKICLPFWKCV